MENQYNNSNAGMPEHSILPPVPNSNGAFVLGILSLISTTVLCICYGFIVGLILSIIGLVLSGSARREYDARPGTYDPKSYQKAKTGRLLNMIGLIISILMTIVMGTLIYMGLNGQLPPEFQEGFDRGMNR